MTAKLRVKVVLFLLGAFYFLHNPSRGFTVFLLLDEITIYLRHYYKQLRIAIGSVSSYPSFTATPQILYLFQQTKRSLRYQIVDCSTYAMCIYSWRHESVPVYRRTYLWFRASYAPGAGELFRMYLHSGASYAPENGGV
jgi:hypothetical protein